MKSTPRVGQSHELSFLVDASNQIRFADDAMPPVLATPALAGYLEQAAREFLTLHCLDANQRSVGTYLELEHLAPTPLGARVTCRVRVIHVEAEVVAFQVEAHDQQEPICRGIHRRRVIDVARFARRVARKSQRLTSE